MTFVIFFLDEPVLSSYIIIKVRNAVGKRIKLLHWYVISNHSSLYLWYLNQWLSFLDRSDLHFMFLALTKYCTLSKMNILRNIIMIITFGF
jgi:hypothetical protein